VEAQAAHRCGHSLHRVVRRAPSRVAVGASVAIRHVHRHHDPPEV